MNVGEYINRLSVASSKLIDLCPLATVTSDGKEFTCNRCPMHKAEGKCCPVNQVTDIKRTLVYAVENVVHGITADTPIDDPMVVLLMKRAVILNYSVFTLRYCDDEYIKLRNLLPIELITD
jgi:hypothetical protein